MLAHYGFPSELSLFSPIPWKSITVFEGNEDTFSHSAFAVHNSYVEFGNWEAGSPSLPNLLLRQQEV